MPKIRGASPKGTSAKAATAVMIEITGASTYSGPTDVTGRESSFVANLMISASGCSSPYGPTRLGP